MGKVVTDQGGWVLYRFDAEHLVFSRFEVQVGAAGLTGAAWGEPLDPARHARDVTVSLGHCGSFGR